MPGERRQGFLRRRGQQRDLYPELQGGDTASVIRANRRRREANIPLTAFGTDLDAVLRVFERQQQPDPRRGLLGVQPGVQLNLDPELGERQRRRRPLLRAFDRGASPLLTERQTTLGQALVDQNTREQERRDTLSGFFSRPIERAGALPPERIRDLIREEQTPQQRATAIRRLPRAAVDRPRERIDFTASDDQIQAQIRGVHRANDERQGRLIRQAWADRFNEKASLTLGFVLAGPFHNADLGILDEASLRIGPIDLSLGDVARAVTSPVNIAVAGVGAPVLALTRAAAGTLATGNLASRTAALGLRGAGAVIEPVTRGGLGRNLLAETGLELGAIAGSQVGLAVAPDNLELPFAIGGGLIGGLAAIGSITGVPRAVDRALLHSDFTPTTIRNNAIRRDLQRMGRPTELAGGADYMVGRRTFAAGIADPRARFEFQYRIVELDELIPSHLDDFEPNPLYAEALQPRDRSRQAAQTQVREIADDIDNFDEMIGLEGVLDRGPVIMGPDLLVESGNGRTLAFRLARERNPDGLQRYVDQLKARAPEFGIDEEAFRHVRHPILVRERLTPLDRAAREVFVRDANASAVMSMSVIEQAIEDVRRVSDGMLADFKIRDDETIEAALAATKNAPFRVAFFEKMSTGELGQFSDAGFNVNQFGLQRMKAAMGAAVFGGDAGGRLMQTLFESTDDGFRNIENAIFGALPDMARANGLIRAGLRAADLDLSEDLARAVEFMLDLRKSGLTANDYIQQIALFERPLTSFQEQLLSFLDSNKRSRPRVQQMLKEYARRIEEDPVSGGGLLDLAPGSKEELFARSTSTSEQARLFGPPEGGPESVARTIAERDAASAPLRGQGDGLDAGAAPPPRTPAAVSRAGDAGVAPRSTSDQRGAPSRDQPAPSQISMTRPAPAVTARTTLPSSANGMLGSITATVGAPRPILQALDDAGSILAQAPRLADQLASDLEAIVPDGFVATRVKEMPRIAEKLQERSADQISDYVGGRAIVADNDEAARVIAELETRGWERFTPEGIDDTGFVQRSGGYEGRHIQLLHRETGVSVELQFQTPQGAAAQMMNWRIYAVMRSRDPLSAADLQRLDDFQQLTVQAFRGIDTATALAIQRGQIPEQFQALDGMIDRVIESVRPKTIQTPEPTPRAAAGAGGQAPPRGTRPPRPPEPPQPGRTPDEVLRELAELPPGEDPGLGFLRRYEGQTNFAADDIRRTWDDGNKLVLEAGVGRRVARGGTQIRMAPEEWLDPTNAIRQLFLALHGEGAIPAQFQRVADFIRPLIEKETAAMLDFDPKFMAHPDYFPRGWKQIVISADRAKEILRGRGVGRGALGATPAFKKPRVDATFEELLGHVQELPDGTLVMLVPRSSNPIDMLAERLVAGIEWREQTHLMKMRDGAGIAVKLENGAPVPDGYRVPEVGPGFEGKPLIARRVPRGSPANPFAKSSRILAISTTVKAASGSLNRGSEKSGVTASFSAVATSRANLCAGA